MKTNQAIDYDEQYGSVDQLDKIAVKKSARIRLLRKLVAKGVSRYLNTKNQNGEKLK